MSEPGNPWTQAWVRGQQELLRSWLGSAAPGGRPSAPEAGEGEFARRFFGLYDQYFGVTRSLWETLQSGATPAAPTPTPMPALELPALGVTREQQEAWQRLGTLAARVSELQTKLSLKWGEVVQRAIADVAARVNARAAADEPVQSLKALYELWIECAEGAYAETAHGAEYVELQAELVNATSALRIEQRGLIERWAREYDLPTRAELDSVHLRLKELGAQLRTLQAGTAPAAPERAPAPRRRRKPAR